jgi:hypothetical protein
MNIQIDQKSDCAHYNQPISMAIQQRLAEIQLAM